MAQYKSPATRKALKAKVKALLAAWVDENLDDSGDINTVWDDADESGAGAYQDEIEHDKSHAEAMSTAREVFINTLQETLPGLISDVLDDFKI